MSEVDSQGLAADLIRIETVGARTTIARSTWWWERAAGVWVYAIDGRRYLDCLSAYSASPGATAIRASCRRCSTRRRASR